jgi:hypothetical protein
VAKAAKSEPPEPVSVADQKAAGVPEDETVTIAEQKAGKQAPPEVADEVVPAAGPGASEGAGEPHPVQPLEEAQEHGDPDQPGDLRPVSATSNESAVLPPNAQAGAARAHALLSHAREALDAEDPGQAAEIIARAQAELDRYIPDGVREAGVAEAAHVVATEVS